MIRALFFVCFAIGAAGSAITLCERQRVATRPVVSDMYARVTACAEGVVANRAFQGCIADSARAWLAAKSVEERTDAFIEQHVCTDPRHVLPSSVWAENNEIPLFYPLCPEPSVEIKDIDEWVGAVEVLTDIITTLKSIVHQCVKTKVSCAIDPGQDWIDKKICGHFADIVKTQFDEDRRYYVETVRTIDKTAERHRASVESAVFYLRQGVEFPGVLVDFVQRNPDVKTLHPALVECVRGKK